MREIKFYRTYSYSEDNAKMEIRDFETEELAREDALNDNSNVNFSLFEQTMKFDGNITVVGKFITMIPYGKQIKRR